MRKEASHASLSLSPGRIRELVSGEGDACLEVGCRLVGTSPFSMPVLQRHRVDIAVSTQSDFAPGGIWFVVKMSAGLILGRGILIAPGVQSGGTVEHPHSWNTPNNEWHMSMTTAKKPGLAPARKWDL